jgi:hypothetical protein
MTTPSARPSQSVSRQTNGSAQREMSVSEWKAFEKNTLKGFLSLVLPSGLILRGCSYHQKSDARWIGLPAREYIKDGAKTWAPIVEFTDAEARQRFQRAALQAVDRHLASGGDQ